MSTLVGATKSKTMWVAAILAVLGALATALPELQQYISPKTYGLIMMGISGVMAVLRVLTTQSLGDKAGLPADPDRDDTQ